MSFCQFPRVFSEQTAGMGRVQTANHSGNLRAKKFRQIANAGRRLILMKHRLLPRDGFIGKRRQNQRSLAAKQIGKGFKKAGCSAFNAAERTKR